MTFIKKLLIGIAALAGVLSLGSIAYADRVAPQANSLGGGSFNFVSNVGLASSSPWAVLSVSSASQSASPLFAIGSTTNSTLVVLLANGNMGIGLSNPGYPLEVVGNITTSGSGSGIVLKDRANNIASSQWYSPTNGNTRLFDSSGNSANADLITFVASTGVGIGTSTPISSFQATNATANATTSIQLGKPNQNKGTCITYYDTAGTPVYGFIAAAATSFTYTSTKPSGCQN